MFYRFTWRKQSTTAISIGRPGRGKVRREEGQRMKEKDTIYENLFRKVAFQDDEQAFKELFLEFYPALCVYHVVYQTGRKSQRHCDGLGLCLAEQPATGRGYYELDSQLNLIKKEDPGTHAFIREKFAVPEKVIDVQESSVLVVDDKNRRWRLPLGDDRYKQLTDDAQLRICREVATERDLFHSCGTFYELPAENADGFAKIRPISSHDFRIHDYASYRGLLVMTSIEPEAKAGEHVVRSDDSKAAVWVGVIDDLWELGKPVGHGPWMTYKKITVKPGETFNHQFPDNFQARLIRFSADRECAATTWLEYK